MDLVKNSCVRKILYVLDNVYQELEYTGNRPCCQPMGLYVIAALIMKPEPVLPLETEDEREFYHSYTSSRPMALNRLKKTSERLERRIRRMEDIVTAKDYEWESRLGQ